MFDLHTFSGGDFSENGYVLRCGAAGPGIVIDPGAAVPSMVEFLNETKTQVGAVLLTHAHLDHVEGVPAIRALAPEVPLYLHPGDHPLYQGVDLQARAFNLPRIGPLPTPDRELAHGQELIFGDCRIEVRHAPGHAPGHVIFHVPREGVAFVGDVIFQGAIGRADLVGGNFHQLMDSIRTQVLTLPDDTRLHSGHGPSTTVGWERRTNPFLVGHYGGDLA